MKEQSENNDLTRKFDGYTYPVGNSNWDKIAAGIFTAGGDGFLGEKFSNYAIDPSPKVWREVKAQIALASRERLVYWWWYGAAAALILFGYFAFLQFNSVDDRGLLANQKLKTDNRTEANDHMENANRKLELAENDKSKSSSSASAKAIPSEASNNSLLKSKIAESRENIVTQRKIDKASIESNPNNYSLTTSNIRNHKVNSAFKNQILTEPTLVAEKLKFIKAKRINSQLVYSLVEPKLASATPPISPTEIAANSKKQKSTPFYDGTETALSREFTVQALSQLAFAKNENPEYVDYGSNSVGLGIAALTIGMTSIDYTTPIYYGVNGEIKLRKRFSAGLGLGYLRMENEKKFGSNSQIMLVQNASKNYLSIPVYLKFSFISKPKFEMYITAGHAFDFLIWQNTTYKYYENGELVNTGDGIKEKGNQANFYASVGMQYKFTSHLGVFSEGSIMRYYSLSYDNFYSQQNFWPGLKFGMVVSF